MSITFQIKRESRPVDIPPPCPKCGAVAGSYGNPDCDYIQPGDFVPCGGFGLTPDYLLEEIADGLNVSNHSASIILYDLLGFGHEEMDPDYGTLDPSDVLRRLSIAEIKVAQLVTTTKETRAVRIDENGVSEGCLVVECGYSENRIQRYIDALRRMAENAIEESSVIIYS